MLKSTLNSPERSGSKRPTLPHLFRHKDTGGVVLFVEENMGTCVVPYLDIQVGYTLGFDEEEGWISCWRDEFWSPLAPGESITITVESED